MCTEKISVIVPVYKVEKYLKKCIESLVNQTYTNLEIILVDDGSPDNSGKICDEWALKDNRIIVIHQENAGLSRARNAGLEIAHGEYIGFVDSDDYIHPRMYELLIAAVEKHDADISICREYAFFEDEEPEYVDIDSNVTYCIEDNMVFVAHFLDSFAGPLIWAWNKLYKRSLLEGKSFVEGKKMEDIFFMSEVAADVKKAVWTEARLYYYRQRKGSIMNSGNEQVFLDYGDAIVFEYEYLKSKATIEFNEAHLCKCLNLLAGLWVKALQNKQDGVVRVLRKQYIKFYDKNKDDIKCIKEQVKLGIARYIPFVYRILKKS